MNTEKQFTTSKDYGHWTKRTIGSQTTLRATWRKPITKIITDVGNVEAARIMRTDGYRRDFVSAMTGLPSDEIDRLG